MNLFLVFRTLVLVLLFFLLIVVDLVTLESETVLVVAVYVHVLLSAALLHVAVLTGKAVFNFLEGFSVNIYLYSVFRNKNRLRLQGAPADKPLGEIFYPKLSDYY